MRVLVIGASGYIGGRLVPELLKAGHEVICLARDPRKLEQVPWRESVEVRQGDVLEKASLSGAFEGIDAVYYLVHAMGGGRGFAARDRSAAYNLLESVGELRRLVYLGGLGEESADLSEHLSSRREVGRIFLNSRVPTTVLRAGVVIGSGSASFEMLRNLTERLPVMVTPRWVEVRTQPVAVRDVLWCLVQALEEESHDNLTLDIGGPEVMTYREMMKTYAEVAQLRPRKILPVPVLTPRLSSHWVGVVTPVPASVAKPLVGSLRNEAVCTGEQLVGRYGEPPGGLTHYSDALREALEEVRTGEVASRWSDAAWHSAPAGRVPQDPDWSGGTLKDTRVLLTQADPSALWRVLDEIGGANGWYSWKAAWAVRGAFDHLVGAPNTRRGRRDPHHLRVGDALDAWRVEERVENELLRLRAEMQIPGRGWLEFRLRQVEGGTELTQEATFAPKGLGGVLYWKMIDPFHGVVFGSMIEKIVERAEMPRGEDQDDSSIREGEASR